MRSALLLVCAVLACKNPVGGGGTIVEPPPDPDDPKAPFVASQVEVRRLSQAEIDASLEDLLQEDQRPATQLLIEDEFAPYDNQYELQESSQALVDGLWVLVRDVSERLVADQARRDAVVGCTPTEPGDEACFRSFVQSFGSRVFRRTLAPEEVDPFVELLAYATEDNAFVQNDFYTAVALAIQAMLLDPEFLFRIEVGTPTLTAGVFALDGFEVATRIAYLITGSTPDASLLADAAAGTLDTPAGRKAAAAALMSTDRGKTQLARFHAMWLGYRAIPGDPQLLAAFDRETRALIERSVFEEDYLQLFTSTETYVDDALADHYGIDRPSSGRGWVAYPDDSLRSGILGHGSLLGAFSKFSDTSPTQRGILVRTRLMCETIAPPPPDVDVDQPPGGEETQLCKSDRYAAHVENASCAACHNSMDPIGFGLENFDVSGRFRAHDEGLPECTIEGSGRLPDGREFRGAQELAQMLIADQLLQRCAVRQFYTYAIGRAPHIVEDQPIDRLLDGFSDAYRFDEMILSYVESDAFALRREPR